MRDMTKTSEGPLQGVWDRSDNFLGIKRKGSQKSFDAFPVAASAVRTAVAMSLLPIFDAAVGTNFAVQERRTVPFVGWTMIRLWFPNSTNAATNVTDCAVAGSTVFDPGAADAAGTAAALWQPVQDASGNGGWVTQTGAPAFTVPAASGNAFAANASNDGNINMAPSQVFMVYLPQATDAPTGWSNLFIRSHAARGFNNYLNRGYAYNKVADGNYFRIGCEYQASADFVAANQANFAPLPGGGRNAHISNVARIEFFSVQNAVSIWNVGDSIPQGLFSTGQINNFVTQWCAKNTVPGSVIFLPSNYCFEGKPNHTALSFARQELAKTVVSGASNRALSARPNVIFVDPYSNNDPIYLTNGGSGTGALSQSQAMASWSEFLQFVDYAEALGVNVITKTKPPYGILNAGQEAVRVGINAMVRASGRPYLDVDAAVTDGAAIAKILAAMSPDGVHLGDLGQDAVYARMDADVGAVLRRF